MDPSRPVHPAQHLSPERWQRLELILDAALDLPPEARSALLGRSNLHGSVPEIVLGEWSVSATKSVRGVGHRG